MKILYEVRRLIGSGVCVKPQHVLLFFLESQKKLGRPTEVEIGVGKW